MESIGSFFIKDFSILNMIYIFTEIFILMHRLPYLLYFGIAALVVSCSSGTGSTSGANTNTDGFTELAVPGSNATLVAKKTKGGIMLEQGVIRNGKKDGPWTIFHDNESIKSVSSYVNGNLNGAYLEFNNRGQLEKRVEYLDNQFHGLYGEYKYGRPLREITYDMGVQNGPFRTWNDSGKITQMGSNKNGKLDGTLQYFDENQNLIMKYEYKNGEQVSGGLVN